MHERRHHGQAKELVGLEVAPAQVWAHLIKGGSWQQHDSTEVDTATGGGLLPAGCPWSFFIHDQPTVLLNCRTTVHCCQPRCHAKGRRHIRVHNVTAAEQVAQERKEAAEACRELVRSGSGQNKQQQQGQGREQQAKEEVAADVTPGWAQVPTDVVHKILGMAAAAVRLADNRPAAVRVRGKEIMR